MQEKIQIAEMIPSHELSNWVALPRQHPELFTRGKCTVCHYDFLLQVEDTDDNIFVWNFKDQYEMKNNISERGDDFSFEL